MLNIKELRAKARESLKGNWMKLSLCMVLSSTIIAIISGVSIYTEKLNPILALLVGIVIAVAIFYLTLAFSMGVLLKTIHVARGEESNFFKETFTKGAKLGVDVVWALFKKYLLWILMICLGCILSAALGVICKYLSVIGVAVVIASLIKMMFISYDYFLIAYLKNDYPDKDMKEIMAKSKEIMYGNRSKVMVIPFTLLGWGILTCLAVSFVCFGFEQIWPSHAYLGITVSTIPVWGVFVRSALISFVTSFVAIYQMMTLYHFYKEQKPEEVFNEDYQKPETNSKKYIKIAVLLYVLSILFVVICAVAPALLISMTFNAVKPI